MKENQKKTRVCRIISLVFIAQLFFGLSGCTSTEDMTQQINGVWRGVSDNAMVTINITGQQKSIDINGNTIPVTINSVDNENYIVTLNLDYGGQSVVWTIRQVWEADEKSFTLSLTLHDGTNDSLAFVRNLSASTAPQEKSFEALYTECVQGSELSCDVLINTKFSLMTEDKQKLNLQKLCVKYSVQLACDKLS